MQFTEKIRKREQYPEIRGKEGQEYPGVDVVFFERDGGVSKDRKAAEKVTGVYAGLNAFTIAKRAFSDGSPEQQEYVENVAENIRRATDYIGAEFNQFTLLDTRYGKGDGPHIINKTTLEQNTFDEYLIPKMSDKEGVKIRKRAGDVIMTDDPDTPIAIVGADAHPIAIKATKPDGSPVVCLIVGSHQGLLEHGMMRKAINAMHETYAIDVATVQIDVGPGLGPDSIDGWKVEEGRFSNASYEIGMDFAMKYMLQNQTPQSPYYGSQLKFFDNTELQPDNFKSVEEYEQFLALSGSESSGNPIFRAHPIDKKKCVIDIEALVQQTASLSGVRAEKVVSASRGNFFSARSMAKMLDIEAVANSHATVTKLAEQQGITPHAFLTKPENRIYLYDGIGRSIFIARVRGMMQENSEDRWR